MAHTKRLITLTVAAMLCLLGQAQVTRKYGMGLADDYEAIRQMPMKKELLTRSFEGLPRSSSLQQYCPRAGSQGEYATCTAWATTYAAMTIMEAVRWGWTDRDVITSEAFAPLFVYAKKKWKDDSDCNWGIGLYSTLPFLKDVGAPKHRNYETPCTTTDVPRWVEDEAIDHKIVDYLKIFDDPYPCQDAEKKIRVTKKAIVEKKPVIIAMDVPLSFDDAGEVWEGTMKEGEPLGKHSLCVVGYDDDKAGGAFLLFNSWGEQWGKDGFTWVRYDDFSRFVNYAFELYAGSEERPVIEKPTPVQHEEQTVSTTVEEQLEQVDIPEVAIFGETKKSLAGSMELILSTGDTLQMERKGKTPCLRYRARTENVRKFIESTLVQIQLTNNEPAYVYMIGTDEQNKTDSVFPPYYDVDHRTIHPLLSYPSTIALPSEDIFAELSGNSKKDFLCVLYSRHALPMDSIMDYLATHGDAIEDKLASTLDTLCPGERVQPKDIISEPDKLAFRTTTTGNIVPLIVEMRRK